MKCNCLNVSFYAVIILSFLCIRECRVLRILCNWILPNYIAFHLVHLNNFTTHFMHSTHTALSWWFHPSWSFRPTDMVVNRKIENPFRLLNRMTCIGDLFISIEFNKSVCCRRRSNRMANAVNWFSGTLNIDLHRRFVQRKSHKHLNPIQCFNCCSAPFGCAIGNGFRHSVICQSDSCIHCIIGGFDGWACVRWATSVCNGKMVVIIS